MLVCGAQRLFFKGYLARAKSMPVKRFTENHALLVEWSLVYPIPRKLSPDISGQTANIQNDQKVLGLSSLQPP